MSGSYAPFSPKYTRYFVGLLCRPVPCLVYLSVSLLIMSACGKDNPTGTISTVPFKITVTPESSHVTVDQTVSLTASVQDQHGEVISGASVSWRSRDESVARVNAEGLVSTIGHGTTVITATSGQVQGNSSVTVSNPVRAALQTLYDTTGGSNWTNSANWLSDESVSEWYGVSSNASNQGVGLQSSTSSNGLESLDLSNNQLAGEIPAALGNLTDLHFLDLSQNSLTGEIPQTLGNLSKLETLRLNSNLLSGELPTELGNLSNLQELSLHDNADLTGPLPLSLTQLDTLETLSLSGTLLCAPTDTTFQNWLEGIENTSGIVNCGDNAVFDRNVLIALYNATDGTNWKSSTNWLTDEPLESWYGVAVNTEGRVDSLILEENDLSGTLPASLGNLTDLQMLDLSDNVLSGNIPSEVGDLTSLLTLDLSNNMLSGEIPFAVLSLPNLQTLDLSGNQFASLPTDKGSTRSLSITQRAVPTGTLSTNWLSEEPISIMARCVHQRRRKCGDGS